jgi:hypothetical protein
MAHRHNVQKRASGGRTVYSGAGSNVAKEAAAKKCGGALAMDGKGPAKKARGGGVGSDKSPFSSAGGGGASKHPFSSAHRG